MALNSFTVIATLIAISFLGGTYVIDNELGQSFCLGAFSTGLTGAVALLAYNKLSRVVLDRHVAPAKTETAETPPVPATANEAPTVFSPVTMLDDENALFAGMLDVVELPGESMVFNSLAAAALLIATLFLGGTYVVESNIGQSFCLGAFATGLAGSMLLLGYTKIARVTDQKRVEQALRASEARFKTWIEHATDMLSVLSADGTIRFEAPAIERILGYAPNDLVGRSIFDFIHPESIADFRSTLIHITENVGRVCVVRYQFLHASGAWRVLETSAKCIRNGTKPEIISNSRDITERTQMENDLRSSEERFKDFAETAADYFWETDRGDRFTYLSERFQEKTRLKPAAALANTRSDVLSSYVTDRQSWSEHLEDLKARRAFSEVELKLSYPDGALRVLRDSGRPVFDADGEFIGYRGATRDVTDAHVLAEKLSHQAKHDLLTGLVNRDFFDERLGQLIDTAKSDGATHVLCYIDLDQFKVVNKTGGHHAGDSLLRELAARLQESTKLTETLARVGGDEFAMLIEQCSLAEGEKAAARLRETIAGTSIFWQGVELRTSASVGLVAITNRSTNVADVLSAADTACFIAKELGRDRIHVSCENDTEVAKHHHDMLWVNRLRRALKEGRLRLSYQPIVPLLNGGGPSPDAPSRMEILLRLEDEAGNIVPPSVFLPAAERYSLITQIDEWVFNTTAEWLASHRVQQERLELCSINLSGQSLAKTSFAEQILAKLEECDVPPNKICFEITETAVIANLSIAMQFMHKLKAHGCKFALDDFGSGLSSFAYLRTLPVDFLKIDGFFVRNIASNPIDLAMVKSINEIGHVMGIKTIAEYADDSATLAKLSEIGVDYAQGYGVREPLPLSSLD